MEELLGPNSKVAAETDAIIGRIFGEIRPYSLNAQPSQIIRAMQEWPIVGWCQSKHAEMILRHFNWSEDGSTYSVFHHDNPEISAFVNENLKNLGKLPSYEWSKDESGALTKGELKPGRIINGSFKDAIERACMASTLGHLLIEKAHTLVDGRWMLESLLPIPIAQRDEAKTGHQSWSYYDFAIKQGRWLGIIYHDSRKARVEIPAEHLLYLSSRAQFNLDNDLRGKGRGEGFLLAFDSFKIVVSALLKCAQSQGGKRLWAKASSTGKGFLLDEKGKPMIDPVTKQRIQITGAEGLRKELAHIKTADSIVTGLAEDIKALDTETRGRLLSTAWDLIKSLVMESYGFSETMLTTSSREVGAVGGMAESQAHESLQLRGKEAQSIKDVFIEAIADIIIWNFGEQENYGYFPNPEEWTELQLRQSIALSEHFGRAGADEVAQSKGDEFYYYFMRGYGLPSEALV